MMSAEHATRIGFLAILEIGLFSSSVCFSQDSPAFRRGDVNDDFAVSLEDVLRIVEHLYIGEPPELPCDDAADANDDGSIDLGDAIVLLFHLFEGWGDLPAPFPACGADPSPDDGLNCDHFWRCGTGKFTNLVGMTLMPVPSGEFLMGSPPTEKGRFSDEVLHRVVLACPFYMSATEVTQGEYLSVMGVNPSSINGDRPVGLGIIRHYGEDLSRPVETVSWYDAQKFCARLSEMDGQGRKYRLPYEAEWEYACRAGTTTRFWFGDLEGCAEGPLEWGLPCPGADPFMARLRGAEVEPVRTRKENPWGFFGMYGNVNEWCADWYGLYPTADFSVNPQGPPRGTRKVVRGHPATMGGLRAMRSAARITMEIDIAHRGAEPGETGCCIGFRIVLELPTCAYDD